jgi:ABC-2 type transport system permease protein
VSDRITAWAAARLLIRLRLRQQLNQLGALYRFRKKSPARTGTGRKSSTGGLLAAFVAACMLFSFFNMSAQCVAHLAKALGTVEVYKEIRRGWLGVQVAQVTAEIAGRQGIKPPRGALISAIVDAGPAKAAGLQTGDVILRIGDKDVKDRNDVTRIVAATPPGTIVEVTIVRDRTELRKTVTLGVLPEDAKPSVRPVAPEAGSMLSPGVLRGATFVATLLLVAGLLMTLAGREITRPEWDLEWLATLPLPLSTLLSSRLIERALTNSTAFLMLDPFLTVLAWECGYRWTAPLLGIGVTIALLFAVATAQTLVDTGLRMSLAPPKLRNLHAVISIVSVLPLMLALSMAMSDSGFAFGWARAMPGWTSWLPAGLAVRALAAADGGSAALWSAATVGEVLAIVAVGYALLRRQLRDGVVAVGGREAGGRAPRAATAVAPARVARRALLPAVPRRELRLLGRDRAFMAQTLLLPAILVGTQVLINASGNVFVGAVENPANLAAIAFALAATLLLAAFQTLNTEGQALWILYCVPRPLESVLRQKAVLWGSAAAIYCVVVFAIAIAVAGTVSLQFVATALGVFGCDPLAQEVQRRVRPTYLYLYMTLAGLYVYAVYAVTVWQRAAMIVLTALLASALWQKARDQFDYLLDPTASPPARVSVSDGLIAALMFFVLQALVIIMFHVSRSTAAPATMLGVAFGIAGAVTWGVIRIVYWRAGTAGVPRIFGDGMRRALLWGAGAGVAAALAGVAYVVIISAMGLLARPERAADVTTRMVLAVVTVAAAPVFEEFIFRGLIFGGLRRSFGPATATLASAAIFAIVHPPLSVIPVFVMGVVAALIYERTRMLAAPMIVHAVYNAVVVGFQWTAA